MDAPSSKSPALIGVADERTRATFATRVFAPLARLRTRMRLYMLADGAVRLQIALMTIGLGQLLLDWWLKLAVEERAVVNVGISLAWAWVLVRYVIRPLTMPLTDEYLARLVDRSLPRLRDGFATAVQFATGRVAGDAAHGPALIQGALADLAPLTARVPVLAVLNHRRAGQRVAELVALLSITMLAFAAAPQMGVWFQRNWLLRDVPWPQQTFIRPLGFDEAGRMRAALGDDLQITAENHGRVPREVKLRWRTAAGETGESPMTLIVGARRWRVSLGRLNQDMFFTIIGGDERTIEYTVIGVERPAVVDTRVRIIPPAYTELDAIETQGQLALDLLQGSRVEIEAKLNKAVAEADLRDDAGPVGDGTKPTPDAVHIAWDTPHSGSFVFRLIDRDGFEALRPTRLLLRVQEDDQPIVRLSLPALRDAITPRATVPLQLHCEDVYGLAQVRLYVQRNEDPPHLIEPATFKPGRLTFDSRELYDVSRLDVSPGQTVRVWAIARDRNPVREAPARSEEYRLRVVTREELLAEIAARELEFRREFENLLAAQRGIRERIESLLPELPSSAPPPPAIAQQFAGLGRRQESHARRTQTVAEGYQALLAEMRANKVAEPRDERRIADRIIEPLTSLSQEIMPAAAEAIAAQRTAANRAAAAQLPVQQTAILTRMRRVLNEMREWEGFREAITLTEQLIEAQREVHDETVEQLGADLDAILGLDDDPNAP